MDTTQRKVALAVLIVGWTVIVSAIAWILIAHTNAIYYQGVISQASFTCHAAHLDAACDQAMQAITNRSHEEDKEFWGQLAVCFAFLPTILVTIICLKEFVQRRRPLLRTLS